MTLSEYLIEAVARRKAGKYPGMPFSPDTIDLKRFLLSRGFKEYDFKDFIDKYGNTDHIYKVAKTEGATRWFIVGPCDSVGSWWINFGDMKRSFMCRTDSTIRPDSFRYRDRYTPKYIKSHCFDTYFDFREFVNEYFGW